MPSKYLWVAAGTHQEATYWMVQLQEAGRGRPWRYLNYWQSLDGFREPEIVIVGTFWKRPDAFQIYNHMKMTQARITDHTANHRFTLDYLPGASIEQLDREQIRRDFHQAKLEAIQDLHALEEMD